MVLEVSIFSNIDNNLVEQWDLWCKYNSNHRNWEEFLTSTIPGIKFAQYIEESTISNCKTLIEFDSEEHKTWFIMRWS